MPSSKAYGYFALKEPLSDVYVPSLLGRAIPIRDLTQPLGTRIRPRLKDDTGNTGNIDGHKPGNASSSAQDGGDAGSMTEVGSDISEDEKIDGSRSAHDDDGVDLQDLESNIYSTKAVECRDLSILKLRAASVNARAKIEELLALYAQYSTDYKLDFSAKGFRRISIVTPQDKIERLLKHDAYAKPVIALLKKERLDQAAVIVSILTCSEMKTAVSTDNTMTAGAMGGVQNTPPLTDFQLGAEATATTHRTLSGTYIGEVIMACSYLKLRLKRRETSRIKKFRNWVFGTPYQKNDEIEVGSEYLLPTDGTLYMNDTPIRGNLPHILGAIQQDDRKIMGAEPDFKTEGEDDLDFIIFDSHT
jgi:hypothetical protein